MNAPDVLSDDAEHDHENSTHQHRDYDQRSPSRKRRFVDKPRVSNEKRINDAAERYQGTQTRHETDWQVRRIYQKVDHYLQLVSEFVARFSDLSWRARVGDESLAEA